MENFNTIVLNPDWISQGIYKIINWTHEKKKNNHTISIGDFPDVFKDDDAVRYPAGKYPFLFALMHQHYELAYETEQTGRLIIPHLLNKDRPKTLPEFSTGESLMLRYKSELPLPPDTISRFIVRHNKEIKREGNEPLVWRYGVVLKYGDDTIALVREWTTERMITVSVKGKEKTTYLDKLRKTLDNIFSDYKSKKPVLQYRVERNRQIPDEKEKDFPIWLPEYEFLNHIYNERSFYDSISNTEIPLDGLIIKYLINKSNMSTSGINYHGCTINNTAEYQHLGQGDIKNKSVTTFNFHNCNIELQGNLNHLARMLNGYGATEEAKELEEAAKALSEAGQCQKPEEEIKKKGIIKWLERIKNDLENEDSKLRKTVNKLNNGFNAAHDVIKCCNSFFKLMGLQ